jgi:lysyl-tRNA synthetase class 2
MYLVKSQRWVPLWIGRVTFLVGLFDILANVSRKFRAPVSKINSLIPVFLNGTALATAIFTGLILMILARGLSRRKRRAWVLAIVILIINLGSELFRSNYHPDQIASSLLIILLLGIFHNSFYAKSDPTTKLQPLIGFGIALVVLFISSLLLLKIRPGSDIIGYPSLKNIFQFIVEGFVGISGPIRFTSERTTDLFAFTLGTFGVFTLLVPLWLYFRRIKPIPKMTTDDMSVVRKLIKHDLEQDSLGYFATRRDKSVIWASNRKAGIAYRVQGGVMLASGDPFGEYSLWPEAISEFMKEAQEHAWTPAVMGCSDRGGEVWVQNAGMIAVDIGDEAIISVKDFTLEGRPMANVRQMVNRIKRKGYSCTTHKWSELDEDTRTQLRRLGHEWRYGVAERGFSMSMDRFGDDDDPDTFITIAWLEGEIKGLLYYVPWTTNGQNAT